MYRLTQRYAQLVMLIFRLDSRLISLCNGYLQENICTSICSSIKMQVKLSIDLTDLTDFLAYAYIRKILVLIRR